MAYQDPSNPRRPDDYLDRGPADWGWTPTFVALAILAVCGFLIFGAPRSADQPSTTDQRSELPRTAPNAPSIPTPSPPKPQ